MGGGEKGGCKKLRFLLYYQFFAKFPSKCCIFYNILLNSKRGFTIIEVVLVLAIAGLIFMMVFLALPALQRSQRDTQRRDQMSSIVSQLQQYQSNNRGKVPTDEDTLGNFVTNYITGDEWLDPSTGDNYSLNYAGGTGVTCADVDTEGLGLGEINYMNGCVCDGESMVAGNTRNAAIISKMEGAGIYCGNV